MVVRLTEDKIRTEADAVLGLSALDGKDGAKSGTGQITTFNQLGFQGVQDKPDGWYLPSNRNDVALVLEAKASTIPLGRPQAEELLKNIRIVNEQYHKTVGLLYNGDDLRVFKNLEEVEAPAALQAVGYYLGLFNENGIDKDHIYELTARINNCLHFEFGIKNLYHRMIFTACALVAKRYDAHFVADGKVDYSEFHQVILSTINKEMLRDKRQNFKLNLLGDVFAEIKMNLNVNSEDEKEQAHVRELIKQFIEWVTEISDCINSDAWRGEDVMGIFFNEFNRYKTKSEAGQVFTPEHITDFMYRILEVNKDDRILDATCGSGGFLVKAMANMIREAGGVRTEKAREIKDGQLFGIEYDREIYALACANMLIHKDGKTNLEQMDTREETAYRGRRVGEGRSRPVRIPLRRCHQGDDEPTLREQVRMHDDSGERDGQRSAKHVVRVHSAGQETGEDRQSTETTHSQTSSSSEGHQTSGGFVLRHRRHHKHIRLQGGSAPERRGVLHLLDEG